MCIKKYFKNTPSLEFFYFSESTVFVFFINGSNGSTYDTGLQFVQWAESGQEDSVENITGNDRSSALCEDSHKAEEQPFAAIALTRLERAHSNMLISSGNIFVSTRSGSSDY